MTHDRAPPCGGKVKRQVATAVTPRLRPALDETCCHCEEPQRHAGQAPSACAAIHRWCVRSGGSPRRQRLAMTPWSARYRRGLHGIAENTRLVEWHFRSVADLKDINEIAVAYGEFTTIR